MSTFCPFRIRKGKVRYLASYLVCWVFLALTSPNVKTRTLHDFSISSLLSSKLDNKLIILMRWVRIGCVQKCTMLCFVYLCIMDVLPCQRRSALQIMQVIHFLLCCDLAPKCSHSLDVLVWNGTAPAAALTLCFVYPRFPVAFAWLPGIGRRREGLFLGFFYCRHWRWCLVQLHSMTNRCDDAIDS